MGWRKEPGLSSWQLGTTEHRGAGAENKWVSNYEPLLQNFFVGCNENCFFEFKFCGVVSEHSTLNFSKKNLCLLYHASSANFDFVESGICKCTLCSFTHLFLLQM